MLAVLLNHSESEIFLEKKLNIFILKTHKFSTTKQQFHHKQNIQ